jgi:hypothetical protein
MKKKFLKGLLIDMIDHLLKTRRITAEHTSFDVILEEAKVMECSTNPSTCIRRKDKVILLITTPNNLVIIVIPIIPLGHAEW